MTGSGVELVVQGSEGARGEKWIFFDLPFQSPIPALSHCRSAPPLRRFSRSRGLWRRFRSTCCLIGSFKPASRPNTQLGGLKRRQIRQLRRQQHPLAMATTPQRWATRLVRSRSPRSFHCLSSMQLFPASRSNSESTSPGKHRLCEHTSVSPQSGMDWDWVGTGLTHAVESPLSTPILPIALSPSARPRLLTLCRRCPRGGFRYLRMIERCLSGSRRFGMVGSRRWNHHHGHAPVATQFGTEVEIVDLEHLSPNLMHVTAVGRRIFRIQERVDTSEGYGLSSATRCHARCIGGASGAPRSCPA